MENTVWNVVIFEDIECDEATNERIEVQLTEDELVPFGE